MIMGDELASQSEARTEVQLTNSIAANLLHITKCWKTHKKCIQILKKIIFTGWETKLSLIVLPPELEAAFGKDF